MKRSSLARRAGAAILAVALGAAPALAEDYLVYLDGSLDLEGVRAPSGEIVQRLKGAHAQAFRRIAPDLHAFGLREGESDLRHYWAANAVGVTVDAAAARELASVPGVRRVEEVYVVPPPEFSPQEVSPQGDVTWSIERVNAPQVWSELGLDGEGVVVGHIDTGVDPSHPDLQGKILAFADFLDEGNTTPKDGQGHGTHTAGTIVGGAAGGTAIGMAPAAKLVVARVFSNQGATTEALLDSMQWILDPDGDPSTDDAPALCSNSWGSNSRTDKSFWDVITAWRAAGILPVFAAGNAGPRARTVGIPGGYPHVLGVGATTSSDGIASFSSRGPSTWDGDDIIKPDVSAPGKGVYSAKDGGGYWSISGTSMACPNVAGAATLMLQAHPGASLEDIQTALEETARDKGPAGKDNDFGTGIIDVYAALQVMSTSTISGVVTGADGAGLAASLDFDGKEIQLPASGEYSVRAAEGEHTLTFRYFGYADRTEVVEVEADESVQLDVGMDALPSGDLYGTVTGPEGEAVAATVTVLGTPLPASQADAGGNYEVTLPVGSYQVRFAALGYHPVTEDVDVGGSVALDVSLEKAKGVLVVDDDDGASFEGFYAEALGGRPGGFEILDAEGPNAPQAGSDLSGYAAVVWVTGDKQTSILSSSLQALGEYLDQGGRLLLTGQNAAQGLRNSSFLPNRMGASLYDDAIATDGLIPVGGTAPAQGFSEADLDVGGDAASHSTMPDALTAQGGAFSFLRYKIMWPWVKRYAGVARKSGGSATVLLGFGLEGMDGAEGREQALNALLDWMQADGEEEAARLRLFRTFNQLD